MQFITNGPEIPEHLLQAHEEGHVVFFCGAGISFPAGLGNFSWLVDKIYESIGTPRYKIEEEAYKNKQYDTVLELLERRIGEREKIYETLLKVLKPNLRRNGATDTHTALLQLAKNRKGIVKLVTTNFDQLFENTPQFRGQLIKTYAAPLLPIPKNHHWDGLVYLHGRLQAKNVDDQTAQQQLVITSSDFGRAYLTERWAARFVSELFRNYNVCFIGYSINDPVMRYMMDALAADRKLRNIPNQAYALVDFKPGQEQEKFIEWEAKSVIPILYEASDSGHQILHRTLKVWAETYRDGILGTSFAL